MTNNGAEKFTEAEELAIEAALKKRLGPNYLSTRPGSYCLSYKCQVLLHTYIRTTYIHIISMYLCISFQQWADSV